MFKYEIENELKDIKDIGIEHFRKYLDKITKKQNKIVLFKNTNEEYGCYYCTKCKKWHFIESKKLKHLKRKDYLTCTSCNTRLEIIYSHNKIEDYVEYITLCETNRRNELIVRVFFYEKSYNKKYGQFHERFYEVARLNIDRKIAMKNNSYRVAGSYYIYHGPTTNGWVRDRSGFYEGYYYDNVYNSQRSIKNIIIKNEKFKYSCLDLAVKNEMNILLYLKLWINYPKIELLMKTRCTNIVNDIIKGSTYTNNPYILNRLDKKGINMLRKYNMSYKELEIYLKTKIDDYEMIKKGSLINYQIARLNHDARKVINYLLDKKYNLLNYEDYLTWCNELGMNMKDKRILYPDDPREAHDRVLKDKTKYEDSIYTKKINDFSKELMKYAFKKEGLEIKPVETQADLIYESKILGHCVRTYAQRVAERKTSIFFIRKQEDNGKPYVTLELKENKVIQCRARNNLRPNDDTVQFVNDWCQKYHFKTCFS